MTFNYDTFPAPYQRTIELNEGWFSVGVFLVIVALFLLVVFRRFGRVEESEHERYVKALAGAMKLSPAVKEEAEAIAAAQYRWRPDRHVDVLGDYHDNDNKIQLDLERLEHNTRLEVAARRTKKTGAKK